MIVFNAPTRPVWRSTVYVSAVLSESWYTCFLKSRGRNWPLISTSPFDWHSCVCVCVAENYYRYYVWTVKYQDYRYVFLQTTMFQNASCHMNYSFIRQQLVAFNCAKAILLIIVQPCFWLTLELRIKVELCEPFARQYDRLLSSWPSAVATLVSLRYDTIRDAILTCARKPT